MQLLIDHFHSLGFDLKPETILTLHSESIESITRAHKIGWPPGRDVNYAGDEAKTAYRTDKIANRGIVRCALVGPPYSRVREAAGVAEYVITTIVRRLLMSNVNQGLFVFLHSGST